MRDNKIAAAAEHAGLGTAEQLVAAVADHVHAGAQAVEHARLATDADGAQVEERAAAEVFHQREACACGPARPVRRVRGCSVNPVIWKFERCTRSNSRVFSLIARS